MKKHPGYGFQLKFGATTLTEQWDPRQGSSWNHFMMGQIDEWFFNSLAGIRTVEGKPGMKEIEIRPRPVGDLTYVRASTETLVRKSCGRLDPREWSLYIKSNDTCRVYGTRIPSR